MSKITNKLIDACLLNRRRINEIELGLSILMLFFYIVFFAIFPSFYIYELVPYMFLPLLLIAFGMVFCGYSIVEVTSQICILKYERKKLKQILGE